MSTDPKPWLEKLASLGACPEGLAYASQFSTWQECWDNIDRGDWSLWVAGRLSGEPEGEKRRPLVLAACECARLSLPFWEKSRSGDKTMLICIKTAEMWAQNKAATEAVKKARLVAVAVAGADAAYAYVYADAAYAALAAISPADSALAAADAAHTAAHAASYVSAAFAVSYFSTRQKALKQCADIVRKHYPVAPELS